MCLNSHYRKQLVFSYDALDNSVNAYDKLKKKISTLGNEEDATDTLEFDNKFKEALANDLNTSLALTTLYDVLKSDLTNAQKKYLVNKFDSVLSIGLSDLEENEVDEELDKYIQEKIEERKLAKQNKDFATADKIRDELLERGIVIKDTREGTIYEIRG